MPNIAAWLARYGNAATMSFEELMTYRVRIHAMYYKIARDHSLSYHALDSELRELETRGVGEDELSKVERRIEECHGERERAAVICVTLAGMSLEAFFYDYGARALGDCFVDEHLDKLDLRAKFLIYPRLICGRSPDKSEHAYSSLSSLVRLRNDLVHFKSRPFKLEEIHKASKFHNDLSERLRAGVDNAVKCVTLVMEELDRLQPGKSFRLEMELLVDA
jgi:hypothetical protein